LFVMGMYTLQNSILSLVYPPTSPPRLLSVVSHGVQLHARATVTGVSSNHFHVLIAFLQDYKSKSRNIPLFTYDLGLTVAEVAFLRTNYPWTTLRTFNFTHHLPRYDKGVALREYAWKPIIIKEMLDTTASVVLWLDSGDRLTELDTLQNVFSLIERDGHVTTVSGGTTRTWVHPATLAFLNASGLNVRMCNAAIVGFDMRAYEKVVRPWAECARRDVCIAPPGSSRENHRQDQAVLTVLLYQAGRRFDRDDNSWIFDVICDIGNILRGYGTDGGLGIMIHQE
jgi:hypothetical protein